MKIDGRCHCGYISYEAEINPETVVICHCTDCQTLSDSAFRTVALTRECRHRSLDSLGDAIDPKQSSRGCGARTRNYSP